MPKKTLPKIPLLLLLLFQLSGIAPAQEVEFPMMQSMTYFPYSDNTLLEKGQYTLRVNLHYSNVYMFNHQRTIINDFEVFSTTLGFRYGLSEKHQLNAELYFRWSTLSGGFLDKTIENFHSTFQFPHNHRAEFPRNTVHYRYKDAFCYKDRQAGTSPLVLALLKNLYTHPDEHFSIKTRIALGIPLSNKAGFNSGKPFLSAGLTLYYREKWLSLDFSNYITWLGKPGWLGEEKLRRQVFFSRLELTAFRVIAGFIFRSSAFQEDDIANNAYQVYVGYKISKHLEFIILEDFAPFDTTPDISFGLRVKIF